RAAQEVSARFLGAASPFSNRADALRWIYASNGELGVYALLSAGIQAAINRAPSDSLRRAAAWSRHSFETTFDRIIHRTRVDSSLLNVDEIKKIISDYADHIDDIEQSLAGESHVLDDMLRRDAAPDTASAVTSLSNYTDGADAESGTPSAPPKETASGSEDIETWLINWLVSQAGVKPDTVDPNKPFAYYGLDSVTGVMLADEFGKWMGRSMPLTLVWDYPTIALLANHLAGQSDLTNSDSDDIRG